MSLPEETLPPEEQHPLPPPARPPLARRRRQNRRLIPTAPDERADFLEQLAHRAYPTLEFFIFSTLAGAVLGAGYLIDSPALLLLGLLLVPLMAPWVGTVLATVTGAWRFFAQTLAGLVIGAALIFVTGLLAGVAARIFMPITLSQAFQHTRLWWPDLFVLVLGSALLPISFARSEEKPFLTSLMIAYVLYLPLSAAAIGLGSGVSGLWPDGLLVFGVHLALSILVGVIAMAIYGFRPYTLGGYTLGTTITLIVIIAAVFFSGLGTVLVSKLGLSNPEVILTPGAGAGEPTPDPGLIPATETETAPVVLPTSTRTPTITPTLVFPTPETPTATIPPLPTPVFARVFTDESNGILVRNEPSGNLIATLLNGYLVEVLPEIQEYNRAVWVKIRFSPREGEVMEGWVIQTLLITATPLPNWEPTTTP